VNDTAYNEAIGILPMTMLLNALRLKNLTKHTRSQRLEFAFHFVWIQLNVRSTLPEKLHEQGGQNSDNNVCFMQRKTIVRFLNTVVVILSSLRAYPDLALDRIGSHPVENFFGHLRRVTENVNTYEHMLSCIAKTKLMKEALTRLKADNGIRSRSNVGGVKLTEHDDEFPDGSSGEPPLALLLDIDPYTAARICFSLCCENPGEDSQFWFLTRFVPYLTELARFVGTSNLANEMEHFFISTTSQRIIALLSAHNADSE
jgi:hypothetical protein